MRSSLSIALVIPCYNEERRLNTRAFSSALSTNSGLTLLFVNDGSIDNTQEVIENICKANPQRALSLSLDKNGGKGEAVRRGMCHLLEKGIYALIGFWDADLAVPLTELDDFVYVFRMNPNVQAVIGSRVHLAGRQIERVNFRHYVGRFLATVMNVTFGYSIYDTQCGAKLFTSEILKDAVDVPFSSKWIFDIEIIIRLSRNSELHYDNWLYEIPVKQWKNIAESKRSISAYTSSLLDYFKLIRKYLFTA